MMDAVHFSHIAVLLLLSLIVFVTLGRIFRSPLKLIFKLLMNTLSGFAALWLVRLTAPVTGISLGLNLFNALVIGILGLPGFFLLLLVQWAL